MGQLFGQNKVHELFFWINKEVQIMIQLTNDHHLHVKIN